MRPLALIPLLLLAARAAEPLESFEDCRYLPQPWADGDSFRIETADGDQHTLRLYGADCLEWHVSDNTDARRLRAQRRYFGISEVGDSAQASIALAKRFGERAGKRCAELLDQPFTVHTTFADARGDGRHPRIYAFVTTHDGRDLASQLVREGLARAFGVYRETPEGLHADDFRERLRDLELQAAQRGAGVWAETDWDKLPEERQLERREEAELALATDPLAGLEKNSVNPNTAARDELMRLPGIGEVTANRIIEHRPFATLDQLDRVPGIGPATLRQIRPFLSLNP